MASICACSSSSSRRPVSWISSGDIAVVVEALQRPPVEVFTARPNRNAGITGCDFPLRLELRNLAIERRGDVLFGNAAARSAQLPGMFFVRRSMDSTSEPPSRAFFADKPICASALSRRKAGGIRPETARRLDTARSPSSCFAYDCSLARYASASPAFSMG